MLKMKMKNKERNEKNEKRQSLRWRMENNQLKKNSFIKKARYVYVRAANRCECALDLVAGWWWWSTNAPCCSVVVLQAGVEDVKMRWDEQILYVMDTPLPPLLYTISCLLESEGTSRSRADAGEDVVVDDGQWWWWWRNNNMKQTSLEIKTSSFSTFKCGGEKVLQLNGLNLFWMEFSRWAGFTYNIMWVLILILLLMVFAGSGSGWLPPCLLASPTRFGCKRRLISDCCCSVRLCVVLCCVLCFSCL